MNKALLLLISLLVSCVHVDSKQLYVEREILFIVEDLENRLDINIKYDIDFSDLSQDEHPSGDDYETAGMCVRSKPLSKKIVFNNKMMLQFHSKYGIENFWPIVLHEIGHCSYGLKHFSEEKYGLHVMNPVFSFEDMVFMTENKEIYLKQFKALIL